MKWEEKIMKSKTSFSRNPLINKTIFWKNVTLFWPLWVLYLLFWLAIVPGAMWIDFSFGYSPDSVEAYVWQTRRLNTLETVLNPINIIIATFIMAIITGMALYNYMFSTKSANWFHSLPITRSEMFNTNVLTGVLFMWVPQFLTFIVSVLVCVSNNVQGVTLIAEWLLFSFGISLTFWAMVTFCAMFSGQIFALPIYFGALNFLYIFVKAVLATVISEMGYGIPYGSAFGSVSGTWLSPGYYLYTRVKFHEIRGFKNDFYYLEGLEFAGGKAVVLYSIGAIVLIIVSALLYKKRNVESAGDLLTFSFVKPIFRWSVGICGGFGASVLLFALFSEFGIITSNVVLLFFVVIVGIVFFFIAEMFVQKKFKVFCKKAWKESGFFAVFVIVMFAGIYGYTMHIQKYVPNAEDVDRIDVAMNYEISYSGDMIPKAMDLHSEIIRTGEKVNVPTSEYEYVNLCYHLKDGRIIRRNYEIALNDATREVLERLHTAENNPDNFKQYMFDNCYGKPKGARLTLFDENVEFTGESIIEASDAEKIYEAVLADIDEGNLQKYNYVAFTEEKRVAFSSDLELEFYVDNSQDTFNYYDEYVDEDYYYPGGIYREHEYATRDDSRSTYITFGPECTNIIKALIETGAIDTADQLYLYPEWW